MSQISFALLIMLGLALTGYYGLAAWRVRCGSSRDHRDCFAKGPVSLAG
jgi:hypothetical protein